MSFQNKRTDNPSFIAKLALVPHKSEQMQNQNNKRNTLASNKSRDHLSVQPKNIYKITSFDKKWILELNHMQKTTKPKNEKICIKAVI